jgi:peroxiredoxin
LITRTFEGVEEEGDMIEPGASAPGFSLKDHLGRQVQLADHRDRHHVLLLFYPLDWTPT